MIVWRIRRKITRTVLCSVVYNSCAEQHTRQKFLKVTVGLCFSLDLLLLFQLCSCIVCTGHTSVDIGASANLEVVDTFCYLGDMLSVDGDADAAVEARIRSGWNKFRQLVSLLTNRHISLIRRGRLYSSCVQNSMLHGSQTWPVRKENEMALQRSEMRMVR